MRIAVRYYTRSGNTRKLAEAIGKAVSVRAESVEADLPEKAELLFLGCSYYAFDVDEAVKDFIGRNRDRIGRIVCFGTSAMMKSIRRPVEKAAQAAGIAVMEDEFHCRGAFGPLHRGRPDEDDLRRAADFAARINDRMK